MDYQLEDWGWDWRRAARDSRVGGESPVACAEGLRGLGRRGLRLGESHSRAL